MKAGRRGAVGVADGRAEGQGHGAGIVPAPGRRVGRARGDRSTGANRLRWGARIGLAIGLLAGLLLLAGPVAAASARFAAGGWGFEPDALAGLPTTTIDATVPFLSAGEAGAAPGLDIELSGSTRLCVLDAAGSACRAASPAPSGALSVLVSLTIDVPDGAVSGPFTLLLTSLVGGLGYGPGDVVIPLDASAPASLDVSAVPGFVFGGALTPFVRVRDRSAAPAAVYDYLGWQVEDGTTITFRYDVPNGLAAGAYPQFTANAIPQVVPEPGTALLLGLGLVGLSWSGARSGARAGERAKA